MIGAYVTVRYWCPNLFNEGDDEGFDSPEDLVRELIQSEGIIGMADGEEIVSIEIKKTPD
jgi:hypothetical protein